MLMVCAPPFEVARFRVVLFAVVPVLPMFTVLSTVLLAILMAPVPWFCRVIAPVPPLSSSCPVPPVCSVRALLPAVEPMVTVLVPVPPVPKLRLWAPVPVPMPIVPVWALPPIVMAPFVADSPIF
jgi:hypothetical protein